MSSAVAAAIGCEPSQVLPFSTGVIGQQLPVARMLAKRPQDRPQTPAEVVRPAAVPTEQTAPSLARPLLLSLGVPLVEALGSGMGLAGGYSDGRDIGVVFNYPNPGGAHALPMCGGSRLSIQRMASGTSTMSSMAPTKGMKSGTRSIGDST